MGEFDIIARYDAGARSFLLPLKMGRGKSVVCWAAVANMLDRPAQFGRVLAKCRVLIGDVDLKHVCSHSNFI